MIADTSTRSILEDELVMIELSREELQQQLDQYKITLQAYEEELSAIKRRCNFLEESNLAIVDEQQETSDQLKTALQQIDKLALQEQVASHASLISKIEKVEYGQTALKKELAGLTNAVSLLEKDSDSAPGGGIFTYIDSHSDQIMFTQAVNDAVNKQFTYAQIDEYFAGNLPADLVKTIKDHPTLTRNYIRSIRYD